MEYEIIILWQIWGIYIFELRRKKWKKKKTHKNDLWVSNEKEVLPKTGLKWEAKYNSKKLKT